MAIPTKNTVIGTYKDTDKSDIYQVQDAAGAVSGVSADGLFYPTRVPVLQQSMQFINTSAAHSVSNTAVLTSLYEVSVWLESRHDAALSTDTLTCMIAYTAPDGDTESVSLIIHGQSHEIQQETYVFLAIAESPIVLSTLFTGTGGAFHYDIAGAMSILPTGGSL